MRKETKAIGIACFLSAFMGTMVTLAVSIQYDLGWYPLPFGAALFGFCAYFLYDIREVQKGASRAWKKVIGWKPDWERWRPDWERWGQGVLAGIYLAVIAFTICFYVVGGLSLFLSILDSGWSSVVTGALNFIELSLFVGVICGILIVAAFLFDGTRGAREDVLGSLKGIIKYVNPVVFPFLVSVFLLALALVIICISILAIVFLVIRMPTIMRSVAKFIKELFIYIHSEERLLCLVDTSAGMAIGFVSGYYYQWNLIFASLIGGVSGCIIGIANYEILSVKILRLKPVRSPNR